MKQRPISLMAAACLTLAAPVSYAVAQEVPQIPETELVEPGKLLVCADGPFPPYTIAAADGTLGGMDPELAQMIADQVGLKAEVRQTVFNTIIAALTGRKCDVIMGAMNITAERQKVITQIPYAQDGMNFAVHKGNPSGIKTTLDLCGAKLAAMTGSIAVDAILGGGDHAGKGFDQACEAAGKPVTTVLQYASATDAFLAVASGQADISVSDTSVTATFVGEHSDLLELSEIGAQEPSPQGIGVAFDRPGVKATVEAALAVLVANGEYEAHFAKYNYLDGAYLLKK